MTKPITLTVLQEGIISLFPCLATLICPSAVLVVPTFHCKRGDYPCPPESNPRPNKISIDMKSIVIQKEIPQNIMGGTLD
jgi:hypothetical protein